MGCKRLRRRRSARLHADAPARGAPPSLPAEEQGADGAAAARRPGVGSTWGRFRVVPGGFGVDLGSIWGRSGVHLESTWGRSAMDLGSIWRRCGADSRSLLTTLNPALSNFPLPLRSATHALWKACRCAYLLPRPARPTARCTGPSQTRTQVGTAAQARAPKPGPDRRLHLRGPASGGRSPISTDVSHETHRQAQAPN